MALVYATRNWWVVLIRGIALVLFGVLALIWPPGITFLALTLLFGAYALIDGIFALMAAFSARWSGQRNGWLIVEGIASIVAGILAFLFTGLAAIALLFLIAAWAIVTGITTVVQAIELRRILTNEWLLILSGVASVIFGALIAFFPAAGIIAVVTLIAVYAIIAGGMEIWLSLRLQRLHQQHREVNTGQPLPTAF